MATTATKSAAEPTKAKAKSASATATKKKEPKKSRPRPLLDADGLKAEEAKLSEKYPQVVADSLRNIGDDPDSKKVWSHKRTVEITCGHDGCDETRRVATSDLHQATMCDKHTMEARLARRRNARATAKAKKSEKVSTAKPK